MHDGSTPRWAPSVRSCVGSYWTDPLFARSSSLKIALVRGLGLGHAGELWAPLMDGLSRLCRLLVSACGPPSLRHHWPPLGRSSLDMETMASSLGLWVLLGTDGVVSRILVLWAIARNMVHVSGERATQRHHRQFRWALDHHMVAVCELSDLGFEALLDRVGLDRSSLCVWGALECTTSSPY